MPDTTGNLRGQAGRWMRLGKQAKAIDAFQRLLSLHTGLADCRYNLGHVLKAEGRYGVALRDYGAFH